MARDALILELRVGDTDVCIFWKKNISGPM